MNLIRLEAAGFLAAGEKSVFLPHMRTARFAAAYLLFTVALVLMMPKANVPETRFDEANTSTNEIVAQKDVSSLEYRQSETTFAPGIFAQSLRTSVRRISPVCAGQLADSRTFLELACTLVC